MSKNDDKPKTKTSKKNLLQGMNIAKLSKMRIIQKHLVYVIGLSYNLASKEVLGKYEYFGQYGTILKIVVNKTKVYNPNGPKGPSFSAYISYSTEQEASLAILSIDNIEVEDHILRASYGTTKYCTFFLKNLDCQNKDCLYFHHLADETEIVNRDDMNSNTNIFYEQQILAMKLADIFNPEIKKKLKIAPKKKCIFPTMDTIYTKDIVLLDQNPEYDNYNYYNKETNNFKYKSKYNDDDYYVSHNKRTYSDHYQNDDYVYEEDYVETDNLSALHREKSENLKSKSKIFDLNKKQNKFNESKTSEDEVSKFISKSKSPITNKKINIESEAEFNICPKNITNSHSPNKNRDEKSLTTTNKDNNSDANKNLGLSQPNSNKKKLYRKRDESRFSFAKGNSDNCHISVIKEEIVNKSDNSVVPDYVSDVICKTISRHSFFSKFKKYFGKVNNDYTIFEKDLKQNDSWSKFIISNMKSENNETK